MGIGIGIGIGTGGSSGGGSVTRLAAPATLVVTENVDTIDLDWAAVVDAASYEYNVGSGWVNVGTDTDVADVSVPYGPGVARARAVAGDGVKGYSKLTSFDLVEPGEPAGLLIQFAGAETDSGAYTSYDLGTAAVCDRWRFKPTPSSGTAVNERLVVGAELRGANSADWSDEVVLDTVPAMPYAPRNQWTERTFSNATAYRYYRLFSDNGSFDDFDTFQVFVTTEDTASSRPLSPTISPWGGRYPAGSTTVTMSCDTEGASIYYTTNGDTPDNTDTLYTAPFSLDLATDKTVKAVAYLSSLGTPLSEVATPAVFTGTGFVAGETIYSTTDGIKLELHATGIIDLDGVWYGAGDFTNVAQKTTGETRDIVETIGIWLYKSVDYGLNWTTIGQILDTGRWDGILRPDMLLHEGTDTIVLWGVCYNIDGSTPSGAPQYRCAAIASVPVADIEDTTAWAWETDIYVPDTGIPFQDFVVFKDEAGVGWLQYDPGNFDPMRQYQLASDYRTITGSLTTLPNAVDNAREAPTVWFKHDCYWQVTSKNNYYDSGATWDNKMRWSMFPDGPWSSVQQIFASDPLGTDYTGQSTQLIENSEGKLACYFDQWSVTELYTSKIICLPITIDYPGVMTAHPEDWDWSTHPNTGVAAVLGSNRANYFFVHAELVVDVPQGDPCASFTAWAGGPAALQATAGDRPTYDFNAFGTGIAGIVFAGSGDRMRADFNGNDIVGPYTIYTRISTASTANQNILSGFDAAGLATLYINNGNVGFYGGTVVAESGGSTGTMALCVTVAADGTTTIYRDGTQVATGDCGDGTLVGGVALGSYNNQAADTFIGSIQFARVAIGIATSGERTAFFANTDFPLP